MSASAAFAPVLESAGWPGLAQLSLGGVGLAWASIVAFQSARGRRVAPALAAAPLALHAAIVFVAVASAWKAHSSAGIAPEEAAALGKLMNNLMLTLTALPTMAVLAVAGFAGGFRAPRAMSPAIAATLAAAALTAFMPLVGLAYGVLGVYAIGRSILYGCGAVLIAGASSGVSPEAREASVTGAVGFFCGVAAIEALWRAINWIHCLAAAAHHADEEVAFLLRAADAIAVTAPISSAAIGFAAIPVAVACFRAPRTPAVLAAAAAALSWLAIWLLADPAGLIIAIAEVSAVRGP